jgi:hypothetical protein
MPLTRCKSHAGPQLGGESGFQGGAIDHGPCAVVRQRLGLTAFVGFQRAVMRDENPVTGDRSRLTSD